MKETQVTKILGEPVKVIKGVKTLWYYPNLYGGHVSFDEKGGLTRVERALSLERSPASGRVLPPH